MKAPRKPRIQSSWEPAPNSYEERERRRERIVMAIFGVLTVAFFTAALVAADS